MPSSTAALAAPDGDNIRADTNSATEKALRMNISLLLSANPCE
jgi:hypothetical protein